MNSYFPIYWMSMFAYPIIVLIMFIVFKFGFKKYFNVTKVIKLSIVAAIISYIPFTLLRVWLPVYIAFNYRLDIIPTVIGELIGFTIGAIIWTVIVYVIGREIYKFSKRFRKSSVKTV